ncbi:hypothetical protein K439DRAFT_725423 [Ramaria rubella]|nr:hypothetical protein K439DRAFT_725423 [Ramaria rubella]
MITGIQLSKHVDMYATGTWNKSDSPDFYILSPGVQQMRVMTNEHFGSHCRVIWDVWV